MSPLIESWAEVSAQEWFAEMRYGVGYGPDLAPGEPRVERAWWETRAGVSVS